MGDPARQLPPPEDDLALSPPLDPPLTDAERTTLLEGLAEADVSEEFRASFRRDIEGA